MDDNGIPTGMPAEKQLYETRDATVADTDATLESGKPYRPTRFQSTITIISCVRAAMPSTALSLTCTA